MFLFLTGELVRRISSGHVSDVRYQNGRLISVSGKVGKGGIDLQVYDTRIWKRIRLIQSPCRCMYRYRHTVNVGSEHITLACALRGIIYTMTRIGDLVHITQLGSGIGVFDFPQMCHTGTDTILVADWENDCLQLRHEGKWSYVRLTPPPKNPRDVVYTGGALFVLSSYQKTNQRISKYLPI